MDHVYQDVIMDSTIKKLTELDHVELAPATVLLVRIHPLTANRALKDSFYLQQPSLVKLLVRRKSSNRPSTECPLVLPAPQDVRHAQA